MTTKNCFAPSGEDVAFEHLQSESKQDPLVAAESEEPLLDICSPCSSCSLASSIVVHISEEERQKYEEEIRKLYKQLDDKVLNWGWMHICIRARITSARKHTCIIYANEFKISFIIWLLHVDGIH